MSFTDNPETKNPKNETNPSEAIRNFVSEIFSGAQTHSGSKTATSKAVEATAKSPAVTSNGQLDFGHVGDLYGTTNTPNKTGGTSKANPAEISSKTVVNSSGVDQANVGDCFFEAALGSLANSPKGQEQIRNMIKTNPDGSYTVTFPGDKSSPVTVTAKDLSENNANGHVQDSAQWAKVVETAFLKYDHAEQYSSGLNNKLQSEGIPNLGNVAYSDKALQLLTGKDVSTDSIGGLNIDNREITIGNTSQANIARNLESALKSGDPVTAGTANGFLSHLGENGSGPLEDSHVFSVLSYDPKSRNVVVRNPWGSNDGTGVEAVGKTKDGVTNIGDGKLEMSLSTFTKYFNSVNIAGQNSYLNDAENIGHDLETQNKALLHTGSDLIHGNFGKLGGDLLIYGKDGLQSLSDTAYGLTDSAERGLKTILADSFDGYSKLAHGLVHAGSSVVHGIEHAGSSVVHGVENTGKTVVHDLNPLNW